MPYPGAQCICHRLNEVCALPHRWEPSPQAPHGALSGLWERLPGVKWPRSGLVSSSTSLLDCSVGWPGAVPMRESTDSLSRTEAPSCGREGQAYSQCQRQCPALNGLQYIVLEGMNGSRVLLNPECPPAPEAVWLPDPRTGVCVMVRLEHKGRGLS